MQRSRIWRQRYSFNRTMAISSTDANLLQRIGHNDDAAFHFEAGTRLKPNSAEAHYSYAVFLLAAGKTDEYVSELRTVLRLKPKYPQAELRLADGLFAKGDLKEAEGYYLAALRTDPELTVAYNNLGKSLTWPRARFPRPWSNSMKPCGAILDTRKPRKTCAWRRQPMLRFFQPRTGDFERPRAASQCR